MAAQLPITNFISPKTPKFICDDCGYSTSIKIRLVDHVKSAHLNNESSGNQSEDNAVDGSEDFIVIACDGLWDTVSPDAAKDSVFKSLKDNKGKADRNNRMIEQLV